jgi:hypothetical protein
MTYYMPWSVQGTVDHPHSRVQKVICSSSPSAAASAACAAAPAPAYQTPVIISARPYGTTTACDNNVFGVEQHAAGPLQEIQSTEIMDTLKSVARDLPQVFQPLFHYR